MNKAEDAGRALVTEHQDGANMYGCAPCPRCGSKYRAAYKRSNTVDCDECGLSQGAEWGEDYASNRQPHATKEHDDE